MARKLMVNKKLNEMNISLFCIAKTLNLFKLFNWQSEGVPFARTNLAKISS